MADYCSQSSWQDIVDQAVGPRVGVRAKYSEDEEGDVALRIKKKLSEEYEFQLCYENSERYAEWADTDPDSLDWNTFDRGG